MSVVVSISKHYKSVLNTSEYLFVLHISAQRLLTPPIPINHICGKINKTDKTQKITLKRKIHGKLDFFKMKFQK